MVRLATDADYETTRSIRWAGNMAISVLWSVYAASLVVLGLRLRASLLRWAGLGLFGLTLLKAAFVDIPSLEGIFRFVALIVLGLLLIAAAWGYQRLAKANTPEASA